MVLVRFFFLGGGGKNKFGGQLFGQLHPLRLSVATCLQRITGQQRHRNSVSWSSYHNYHQSEPSHAELQLATDRKWDIQTCLSSRSSLSQERLVTTLFSGFQGSLGPEMAACPASWTCACMWQQNLHEYIHSIRKKNKKLSCCCDSRSYAVRSDKKTYHCVISVFNAIHCDLWSYRLNL